ncbi:MAG: UDP-N-acetylmuramate:L-alanyl-gamma-D-glutamyl-meso-diaminopimelate ligase [Granulosicoccaceae bacterium]|jgi:UDP-N-acetylmuramate: L-alanyl-gamma-D-glutamyl-meso-diaminopimelate ligase
MHVHILGICGTFMGGLAQLAAAAGHRVSGQDAGVYPPMSTQLEQAGIALHEGYDAAPLDPAPDIVVIGNALSRGNPAVEYVLDHNLPYTSGPQFLAEHVLKERWVLGVAGTHGKTTTASLLAHILDECGLAPGFLIGGVPQGFGVSARLGDTPFFVIEADEYDTAFFDKRSKFVHYHPRTLILNNLEFDHADIFDDLAAIQRQFHHLVRTVPGNGLIIESAGDAALQAVIAQGCWTPRERFALQGDVDWRADNIEDEGRAFSVICAGKPAGQIRWDMTGLHNVSNALAAIAAARHVGVPPAEAVAALCGFAGVKRRMELRGEAGGVTVYDDFAHHPTAIASTLEGARAALGGRIIAVLEPRSNTMRMGVHRAQLAASLDAADAVFLFQPADLDWPLGETAQACRAPANVYKDIETLVAAIVAHSRGGDRIIVMSNGAFGGIHERLLNALS